MIDEISRENISNMFGELITLINMADLQYAREHKVIAMLREHPTATEEAVLQ